ncbi:MAG TPA: dihydroorotate dehydrogenase-like protein [Spirochaetia bacterium]|nr:dihydroorotate dehydrogenase-like protein [Spirochaetales bacterium]HRS64663.1 dihydroorotate dehydrogenase-like protein [Spirochaetia bacterium]HPD79635.1 dihydroorotate dehydrogenase-like protein [Spirochaetales bacterium]HQG39623.1 dihydroorotate dehydrogenase-like protein [Spirochaetales bacterium]HQK33799.1 dihydroorotate dehydrogenase-like protein [Spirochaetales bacterium]
MIDLTTRYLGLTLKHPLIAASSGLTGKLDSIKKLASAGVSAIVLKSLFEEQIAAETGSMTEAFAWDPGAQAWIEAMNKEASASDYLKLIEQSKKETGLPIIASINCSHSGQWQDFAKKVELAGADALELNIGRLPKTIDETSVEIENNIITIVEQVCASTKMPIAVKIGSQFTNPGLLAKRIAQVGAKGLVLFNRFYRLDLNLDTLALTSGPIKSSPELYHESMRWIALLKGQIDVDFAASGGIYDEETVLKMVAAGASVVELCSVLYAKGFTVVGSIIDGLINLLKKHNIASIASLKGRLAAQNAKERDAYYRLQYVKAFVGHE